MQPSIKHIKLWTPFIFMGVRLLSFVLRSIYKLNDYTLWELLENVKYTMTLDFVTLCVFYFFFAPRFFARKKIWLYASLSIIYFFAYAFVWAIVFEYRGATDEQVYLFYFSSLGHSVLQAMYGILTRLAIEWFQKREEKKELEQQNTKTELALLRSQINPHFLFNTLNNINSFAQTAPDKTSFAIVKLSDIMRYMLYEAADEKVMLSRETKYIKDFLELQKIRFGNSDFIDFKQGKIDSDIFIPPLLFIPFIENAFKHGKKNPEKPISIYIEFNNGTLYFTCKNGIRKLNETESNRSSGFGIANIKRRLELLFPEKYELNIHVDDSIYSVELKIILI
jgi:sensor histidine kinase YesM